MAQRVCQRLTHRRDGVKWFVDSFKPVSFEPAGNGVVVTYETFRGLEQREGMAAKLAVVEKLATVQPVKPRDPEQALRHGKLDPLCAAEQHDRAAQKHAVRPQA